MKPAHTRALLLAMILLAGPLVFALDLVGRQMILSVAEEDERALLGQLATHLAWYAVPLPAIGGVIGFYAYRRIYARQLANAKPGDDLAVIEPRADLMALMFGTTCPQLPALLGDMSVMMGARFTPAICCTSLSLVSILAIAIFGRGKHA